MAKASDAIPVEVHAKYMELMKLEGKFWHDMSRLCLDFGLRNIEARELKASDIDLKQCTITLTDSKQVRAYVTKSSNRALDTQWLIEGRRLLRELIGGDLAPLLVRMAQDTKQLAALAIEYGLYDEYEQARLEHYAANIEQARAVAMKQAPKGRVIAFGNYKESRRIITARVEKYGHLCDYLFPACELGSNRANSFEPVTRQSAHRVIKRVTEAIKASGTRFKAALNMVRIGLHSARKAACQKVANAFDVLTASVWLGHGNGIGDISTTQRYLDRSERKMHDISKRLATM